MAELEPARVSRRGFMGTASRAGLATAAIAGTAWAGTALAGQALAGAAPATAGAPDRHGAHIPEPHEALRI